MPYWGRGAEGKRRRVAGTGLRRRAARTREDAGPPAAPVAFPGTAVSCAPVIMGRKARGAR